ncbi:LON peptidase substrate-binding domain-containing protein [Thermaurantiacus sp.]
MPDERTEPFATPADLPATIRVFPLAGAVLLPRQVLPLNIFEPRYVAMTRDAMMGDRLIGIIQPRDDGRGGPPALFETGGLGRITQFSETGDGRFLIALSGLIRFRIVRELAVETPYRQVIADYRAFTADWAEPAPLEPDLRAELERSLRRYLDAQGLSADWEAVRAADDESLVHALTAVCPFDGLERQALLEAPDLPTRAATLSALLSFGGDLPQRAAPGSGRLQ